ncbi:MAG: GNAT family N-acetyltransferase [Rhodobacteraceae bacterium]|nr:GNAT family N-acetyltransferase [Paracoccaceae bacterium]MAY45404.1 GNAT family N-acetyltransferase [Paracoccaceae bacterium]
MLEVATPCTPDDFDAVRQLAWAYRDFLASLPPPDNVVTTFAYDVDAYAAILNQIDILHAPPRGALKLARLDGVAVGCGMMQTIAPGTAEVKRVYITESARGTGAGRAIMGALIEDARALGFQRIQLDTGRPLVAAQKLYLSLGFRERTPYWDPPADILDRLVFFQLDL